MEGSFVFAVTTRGTTVTFFPSPGPLLADSFFCFRMVVLFYYFPLFVNPFPLFIALTIVFDFLLGEFNHLDATSVFPFNVVDTSTQYLLPHK